MPKYEPKVDDRVTIYGKNCEYGYYYVEKLYTTGTWSKKVKKAFIKHCAFSKNDMFYVGFEVNASKLRLWKNPYEKEKS